MASSENRKNKRQIKRLIDAGLPVGVYGFDPNNYTDAEPVQLNQYRIYYKYVVYAEALSRVKWHNLPEGVDARFLELSLFLYGQATITKISGKFLAQIASQYDLWDRQGNFDKWLASGYNGEITETNYKESVLVFDNLMRISPANVLAPLIEDASQSMATASSNLIQQRYGVFFQGTKNNMKDAKRLSKMIGLGESGAVSIKGLDDNIGVKTINPEVDDKSVIAFNAKKEFLNEVHMFLGTEYIEHEKKERLVEDEATANLDKVNKQRELFLIPRKQACKKIKEMYGTDTWVEWASTTKEDEHIERKETDDVSHETPEEHYERISETENE